MGVQPPISPMEQPQQFLLTIGMTLFLSSSDWSPRGAAADADAAAAAATAAAAAADAADS